MKTSPLCRARWGWGTLLLGLPGSPSYLQPDLQLRKPWRGLEMGVGWCGCGLEEPLTGGAGLCEQD